MYSQHSLCVGEVDPVGHVPYSERAHVFTAQFVCW